MCGFFVFIFSARPCFVLYYKDNKTEEPRKALMGSLASKSFSASLALSSTFLPVPYPLVEVILYQ